MSWLVTWAPFCGCWPAGFGPLEAATSCQPGWSPRPNQQMTAVAEPFAPDLRQSATTVIEQAAAEFPDFDDIIVGLCR
ncbi:hypothetical protein GCM10010449_05390 [Streptomyces rectiviolaceus]|uniref:Uncharacterized protein n=1 Tax=Streptomyces rectiviolaceus TaxID=332591 RepID=A0ABP6MB14_9ACTN